jgi:hypothetical protein
MQEELIVALNSSVCNKRHHCWREQVTRIRIKSVTILVSSFNSLLHVSALTVSHIYTGCFTTWTLLQEVIP